MKVSRNWAQNLFIFESNNWEGLEKYKISLLYVSLLLCMCLAGSVMYDSLWPHELWRARLLIHGILQARILEWLPCPPPGDRPDPGIKPTSPASPALQADSSPAQPLRKPVIIIKSILITATAFFRHLEYYFKTKLPTHLLSWQRLGTIDVQKRLPSVCLPTLDLRSCKAPDCLSHRQCYTNTELLVLNYWRRKSRQISLWNRSTCSVGIFMVLDCSASSRGGAKNRAIYTGAKQIITLSLK